MRRLALLVLAFLGAAGDGGSALVLDLHDTRGVTPPVTSFPGGRRWETGPAPAFEFPPEPVAAVDGDALAAFCETLCGRDATVAWREGGILIAKARPDDHGRISRLLRWLRAPRARRLFGSRAGRVLLRALAGLP